MINKTELKDVVLRFQSKTDISIKDIFGEAPSKEQEKMWVKFLKEYFKIEKEFSPEDKHYYLESEYPDEIHQLHKIVELNIFLLFPKPQHFLQYKILF